MAFFSKFLMKLFPAKTKPMCIIHNDNGLIQVRYNPGGDVFSIGKPTSEFMASLPEYDQASILDVMQEIVVVIFGNHAKDQATDFKNKWINHDRL